MPKSQSLQDPFLNALRRERIPVAIYLVNGIKLQGVIESFDQFVVLLRNQVSQMVYKHAISTVVPSRAVKVGAEDAPAADAKDDDAKDDDAKDDDAKDDGAKDDGARDDGARDDGARDDDAGPPAQD